MIVIIDNDNNNWVDKSLLLSTKCIPLYPSSGMNGNKIYIKRSLIGSLTARFQKKILNIFY